MPELDLQLAIGFHATRSGYTTPRRNAALAAGFPEEVVGVTIDRQCGSSQQAAHFAAQGVIAGAYDVVVAAWMLYHLDDLDAGLAEIRRVLRPGGALVAATNSEGHLADLRTEAGGWNHLVVPEAVRVFRYQGEQVEVVAASDPALLDRTAGGRRMLLFELERALRDEPGTAALYRPAAGQGLETLGPVPPGETLAGRLGIFRDVPPPGVPRC